MSHCTILVGDCRQTLTTLPDASVQTCVTSPPYFGLRDYGMADQIGLEQTPDAFVAELVAVFREVKRVLRDDGTLWLNLGDSYAANEGQRKATDKPGDKQATSAGSIGAPSRSVEGLPAKNLIGIPWRVAFALQADGWYLRQDIIWHKPNPMPESVRDRCTKAHEYIFLLSKSPQYYFDSKAIAEPVTNSTIMRLSQPTLAEQSGSDRVPFKTNGPMKAVPPRFGDTKYGDSNADEHRTKSGRPYDIKDGRRNRRSVWTVTTKPYKEAHFATFPPDLIEPCILAGSRPEDIVLDPFGGSGTTAAVAVSHGRRAVLCELNPSYVELATDRVGPMLCTVQPEGIWRA